MGLLEIFGFDGMSEFSDGGGSEDGGLDLSILGRGGDEGEDSGGGCLGVWNCPFGQNKLTWQRLNAAESWVASWAPKVAQKTRAFFDAREKEALARENLVGRALWAIGPSFFPAFGWVAEFLLLTVGFAHTISQQYTGKIK